MSKFDIIEYIRKNGRKKNMENDNSKIKTGRAKKGVLYCSVDPDDDQSVIIGFSLCHPNDRFDYNGKKRAEGFGLDVAKYRAEKWRFHTDYFVQRFISCETFDLKNHWLVETELWVNPDPRSVVEVPASVMSQLKPFIERCKRYFTDKEFPMWVRKINKDEQYDKNLMDTKIVTKKIEKTEDERD